MLKLWRILHLNQSELKQAVRKSQKFANCCYLTQSVALCF
ncbi:hypothetical protein MHH_c03710 [Mannheimia haemolytica M42548]|nr:hypothetical protein MHH_c03710 [Mannheimia haemolytica M42548]EEY13524.1 hypothetical protein COK_0374 [Mannheimia haemolytica serotype A2 str. BOVINE]